MATTRIMMKIVTNARILDVRHARTAAVVTPALRETGDQRVTMGAVQGVKELCVTSMTAVVHVN